MDILETNRREKPHMNIKEYMKRAISDPECELEFVYGDNPRNGRLSKTQFTDTLNYLRQNFKSQTDSTTLDIQLHYPLLNHLQEELLHEYKYRLLHNNHPLNDKYNIFFFE